MTWTLCSSFAIISKAGANANSTAIASSALLADFQAKSEQTFCALTRRDWISDYADVETNLKEAVADAVSDLAAMKVVTYDMSPYTSRQEAQTMLDVMRDNMLRIVEQLKVEANQTFP